MKSNCQLVKPNGVVYRYWAYDVLGSLELYETYPPDEDADIYISVFDDVAQVNSTHLKNVDVNGWVLVLVGFPIFEKIENRADGSIDERTPKYVPGYRVTKFEVNDTHYEKSDRELEVDVESPVVEELQQEPEKKHLHQAME